MIGHSTTLIEIAGKRVLTDPYFGGGNLAYARVSSPARRREECCEAGRLLLRLPLP